MKILVSPSVEKTFYSKMKGKKSQERALYHIYNIGYNKIKSTLNNKSGNDYFTVFQLLEKSKVTYPEKKVMGNQELDELLENYNEIFRNELPHGLPLKRGIHHAIEVQPEIKPPNRPLYQLSPVELVTVKLYVQELLKAGKIDEEIHFTGRHFLL